VSDSWAISSLDLHLDLAGPRVRASLESALREAVRGGRLLPGTRLPASRALATDLGIARNTVADCYAQLVAEGWLSARQGSGTWVAERAPSPPLAVGGPAPAAARRVRYDLRTGVPDVSAFPRQAWLAAGRKALSAAPAQALGYTDPRGLRQLREALAGYLARARGVAVTPDRVVICAGFAQGLELLCEALRARGATTLVAEALGYPRQWRIAEKSGLSVTAVPVDDGGAVIAGLGPADALLLTPTHQFPLGVPLAPARRRQAADWASLAGAVIVEDDYDGELRYDRPAVGALQALAPEHVVYAGTASKSLAPGLRLGWLVVPARLVDEVVAVKSAAGRLSSSLDQLTLAEFLTSGAYDRQVRRVRLAYRRRRDRLVAAVRAAAPQVRVTGIAAGLHALLRLPPDQDEDALVARAARHGLAIEGLSAYRLGGAGLDTGGGGLDAGGGGLDAGGAGQGDGGAGLDGGPALVVGYATPPGHAYSTAVARLCAVLSADR
jgi:GntR family transcriptional regulator/MocR family aminotransferase